MRRGVAEQRILGPRDIAFAHLQLPVQPKLAVCERSSERDRPPAVAAETLEVHAISVDRAGEDFDRSLQTTCRAGADRADDSGAIDSQDGGPLCAWRC